MAQGRGIAGTALAGPLAEAPRGAGAELVRAETGSSSGERLNSPRGGPSKECARQQDRQLDLALVERARAGDRSAFRQLVERHQRRALAIAVGLVRDEQDAREVVQEAFLRVYRGLDSFQGGSTFFTWLYRIITNLSIDWLRRPVRREAGMDAERLDGCIDSRDEPVLLARIDGANPVDVVRRREIATRIRAALEELPPYHRAVIVMREFEGMSYEEMAQAMQVSKGTIMSRLFHARQKLQLALADCYDEHLGPVSRTHSGRAVVPDAPSALAAGAASAGAASAGAASAGGGGIRSRASVKGGAS